MRVAAPTGQQSKDTRAYSAPAGAACDVAATADVVFDHIDRLQRFSAHMERRSWRMAGSSMAIEADAAGGRAMGSLVRLSGRVLGMRLGAVVEVVERKPPRRKAWQTVGEPRLLVIGRYRMTVDVQPVRQATHVLIAVDYNLPTVRPARWLGMLLGRWYARWCVQQMAHDLIDRFGVA
jgi:hypothetical protein